MMTHPWRTLPATLVLFGALACDSPSPQPARQVEAAPLQHAKTAEPAQSNDKDKAPQTKAEPKTDRRSQSADPGAKALVEDARSVVAAIEATREALEGGNMAKAKQDLGTARKALDKILAERPTAEVAVKIWDAGRALDEEAEVELDVVPIFAAMNRLETHVWDEQTRSATVTAASTEPSQATEASKRRDLGLLDASLAYTELDLPIAATQVHVMAAQKLLEEHKGKEANAVLGRALAGIEVIEAVDAAPEFIARQLLWDAQAAFAHGEDEVARTNVTKAAEILAALTKDPATDPSAKTMATALLAELEPLSTTLSSGNAEHGSLLAHLAHRTWALSQRAVTRAMLQKRRSEQQYDLADALAYLEQARAEGLYEGTQGAGGALVLAEAMLDHAAKSAPASEQPTIADLQQRAAALVKLDTADQPDHTAIAAAHRQLMLELRTLMWDLDLSTWLPSATLAAGTESQAAKDGEPQGG